MKKTKQPRQVIIAWALSSVYVMFWLLWGTHHFFAHEHQHEKRICHHAPNEQHFHGEEYASDECPICHFLPAQAEPIQAEVSIAKLSLNITKQFSGEKTFLAIPSSNLSQPRAPPVRLG